MTWPDGRSAIDGCTIWRRWPCHQSPWQGSTSLPQPGNDIFHVSYFSGQNWSHGSIQLQGGLGNMGEQMECWVRITDPFTIPLLYSFSSEGESWWSWTIITHVIPSPLLSILSYTLVYPILTCFLFIFFFIFRLHSSFSLFLYGLESCQEFLKVTVNELESDRSEKVCPSWVTTVWKSDRIYHCKCQKHLLLLFAHSSNPESLN